MKRLINLFLMILSPLFMQSQSIERQVTASAGNYIQNPIGSLTYTVGEPIIVLGTDGTKSLLQGFQQPTYSTTTSIFQNDSEEGCKFAFYPNPIAQIVNVETALQDEAFEVFDANGKSYGHFKMSNSVLNVSALATGIYFIKVNCNAQKAQYYKFIKL